jgi:hypothetical protein
MTTIYCLRFETPPTWRARPSHLYSPGIGWPVYTPRHWVPFSSPSTTRRDTVKVFEPASTRGTNLLLLIILLITSRHRSHRKQRSSVGFLIAAVQTCLFAKPSLNIGCCTAASFAVVDKQRVYMPLYDNVLPAKSYHKPNGGWL